MVEKWDRRLDRGPICDRMGNYRRDLERLLAWKLDLRVEMRRKTGLGLEEPSCRLFLLTLPEIAFVDVTVPAEGRPAIFALLNWKKRRLLLGTALEMKLTRL